MPMLKRLLVAALLLFVIGSTVDAEQWWRWGRGKKKPPVEESEPEAPTYYYVRTDGSNSNNGLTNSAGGAFLTIDFAIGAVAAGDIVRVQAGHYAERVTPSVSGTDGNPITIIADGAASFCGMDVSGQDYIRVIGFTVDMNASGCSDARAFYIAGTSNGWEFWNNTIRDVTGAGIANTFYTDRTSNSILLGNMLINIGIGGGNGTGISVIGNDNIFAYNDLDDMDPDQFSVTGQRNQYLNNYAHNIADTNDHHADMFFAGSGALGLQFNLFEGNRTIGNGSLPNEHGTLFQNQGGSSCQGTCGPMTENLFRYNVWHLLSGGHWSANDALDAAITENRLTNDSAINVQSGSNATTNQYTMSCYGSGTVTCRVHNGINYQAWGTSLTSTIQVNHVESSGSFLSNNYNLAYDPDGSVSFHSEWTNQANELSNTDPSFTNHATADFTLQSGSSARNAGGPLTTTSGSGTGTTFNVASGGGGWFRGPNTNVTTYGGKLTQGDVITVGTDVVTVVSVSTDAITVTPSFTWANAENVYLGGDTTPDLGAIPYFASYSIASTYSASVGGTRTITPADASLVRFVVCYSNGVPYEVDNASPYTCANAYSFSARVYPRYPVSSTLWAVATP
jgi:hypothetical protein